MSKFYPTDKLLKKAAEQLASGGLVAFPTETVYGLGADARNADAVAKIYAIKGRPSNNPLICHIASIEKALEIADLSEDALKLAEFFWPGPLTLILPLKKGAMIAPNVTTGLDTVALRIPSHPIAQKLLQLCPFPLAAPSVNLSGKVSSTKADHVRAYFKDLFILDGGESEKGLESTILDLSEKPYRILRSGVITREELEVYMHDAPIKEGQKKSFKLKAPGMLSKHYAPNLPLRLNAVKAEPGELLISFGVAGDFSLSETGDLQEAARRLFDLLHRADKIEGIKRIAVMPIPEEGIGVAINDRLRRAAKR